MALGRVIVTLCGAAVLLHGLVTSADAAWRLGDYGGVTLGLDADAVWSSNVLLNREEADDFILSATPKLLYRTDEGYGSIDAFIGMRATRYLDLDQYDSDDFKSGIVVKYPDEMRGENFSLRLDAGYNERTAADSAVQDIRETRDFTTNISASYYVSQYAQLRSGFSYSNSISETDAYDDIETTTIPLALYYDVDEALSIGAGYRYRATDTSGDSTIDADSEDHAFYCGVEDLLSPLLQYELKAGVQMRDFTDNDVLDDETGVYLQLRLEWFVLERTRLIGLAGNEFGTNALNESLETFYSAVDVEHDLDERVGLSAGIRYETVQYDEIGSDRTDDAWSTSCSARYALIPDRLTFHGGVRYVNNSSDQSYAEYELIEASLSCAYIF